MQHFFIISFFILLLTYTAKGQEVFKKNSIQIGRTGYYFGDNSFKMGELGGFTNHGWRVYAYTPYLSYSRLQFKHFGIKASFEKYHAGYYKGRPFPEPFIIFGRYFSQFQIDAFGYVTVWNKLTILGTINFSRRYKGKELFVETFFDHVTWVEGVINFNNISGWGMGTGLEIKYNFYKKLSISLRGEYLKFNGKPRKQYGLNTSLGYDF